MTPYREPSQRPISRPKKTGECCTAKIAPVPFAVPEGEQTKGRYKFPYGDFVKVHRCGVLAAESRAGQYKYASIERAAAHLHGMIEAASAKATDGTERT